MQRRGVQVTPPLKNFDLLYQTFSTNTPLYNKFDTTLNRSITAVFACLWFFFYAHFCVYFVFSQKSLPPSDLFRLFIEADFIISSFEQVSNFNFVLRVEFISSFRLSSTPKFHQFSEHYFDLNKKNGFDIRFSGV